MNNTEEKIATQNSSLNQEKTEEPISDNNKTEYSKRTVENETVEDTENQISAPNLDKQMMDEEEIKLKEDLKNYYENHFSLDTLWEFIDQENFSTREFGFLRFDTGFTRNKSFEKPEYLIEYLITFPVKAVYVGAVYKDRLVTAKKVNDYKGVTINQTEWLGKELFFDLDIDAYDPVRRCGCEGREICEICWQLLQEAADIIDDTLRMDFGFETIKWVFTGGRGYHCWVLDDKAFSLDRHHREAIVKYIELITTNKNGRDVIQSIPAEATRLRKRIYQKLARSFIMEESNKFLIENAGFTKYRLKKAREKLEHSNILKDIIEVIPDGKKGEKFFETLVKYHYPRVDQPVTYDIKKVLRMPGSIHDKTKMLSEIVEDPVTFNPINDGTYLDEIL